jgi:hypothetical protein
VGTQPDKAAAGATLLLALTEEVPPMPSANTLAGTPAPSAGSGAQSHSASLKNGPISWKPQVPVIWSAARPLARSVYRVSKRLVK